MNLVDIPPGESIPEHDETARDQEELFFVVSGSPVLVIDGQEHPAPAGTFACLDPPRRRTVRNTGSDPCSVLIVSAPTTSGYRADGVGMTAFPTVRVAAIQATPVILDAERSVEKAERLLHEAADRGVQLAVLPECFIPLYPSNAWARGAAGFGGWDELWERLWANSVDIPGRLLDRLDRGVSRTRAVLRARRQRARVRATRHALQHDRVPRPLGPACASPQADADPARAAVPRDRRRR